MHSPLRRLRVVLRHAPMPFAGRRDGDCGAAHPLVPYLSCERGLNHRGRHAGRMHPSAPGPRERWEQ
jgi:hypothetical protein